MLLLEARKLEKSYGDRLILKAEKLEVLDKDRIGIVGQNGTGKSTLLRILAGELQSDNLGKVMSYADLAFIRQVELDSGKMTTTRGRKNWGVSRVHDGMSGGEQVRLKIASALEQKALLLFADEPTSHLDLPGIRQLEEALRTYSGAVLLISHDRELLDAVCTQIWEVENGTVKQYKGNYSAYREQKEQAQEREWFEYEAYEKEKERLKQAVIEKKQQAKGIRDAPKRMSSSEAKLHKMQAQGKREKVEQSAKAVESRLAKLEKKEKPHELARVRFDLHHQTEYRGKTVIQCLGISARVDSRTLFSDLSFTIRPGQKVALIGANGTGKSTLLSMIHQNVDSVTIPPSIRLGYFSQSLSILEEEKTILENVKKHSMYPESTIRTALARLLFPKEAVHKAVCALSGGERVKIALAKIFFGDYHALLLDEPTNYLDIPTQEELEIMLADFPGTILFATHDRKLIQGLANAVLCLDDPQPVLFTGTFQEYVDSKNRATNRDHHKEQILLLENKLTGLVSRLSSPLLPVQEKEILEEQYQETLQELKQWRGRKK
ncbi:ribosomal protection-like ABC-F family protein [Brevibacillus sp. NRS-1366]|uniref:ribosomal protection-like ABC-F family protein n=1 Tax=Brevibacillus sp. NRS-1366 TaxID=3233899 RepID=UPI003D1BAA2A